MKICNSFEEAMQTSLELESVGISNTVEQHITLYGLVWVVNIYEENDYLYM